MHSKDLLGRCRYEVLPLARIAERVPQGGLFDVPFTVTCSPSKGVEATLQATERLAALGASVVPHIAARQVRDRAELREIVRRLDACEVKDVFIPGGDVESPAGDFEASLNLLEALDQIGHPFTSIGVAGYPEGHPLIDDASLENALRRKARFATYIVTQMCFSGEHVARWLHAISDVELDVFLGVPGVVDWKKLLTISLRIGVGESLRFLRKQSGIAGRLLGFSAYRPDGLIGELAASTAGDPRVVGLHIYTFNQVQATDEWLRTRLAGEDPRAAEAT